ncbi:MAG: substrate-binding domain-containing protein [Phycisphaerales bacterium]
MEASLLKYEAVKEKLAASITSHQFKAGQRLPSVRRLAEQWKVSNAPVCRAIADLCQEGVIERIPGQRGVFVSEQAQAGKKADIQAVAIVYEGSLHRTDGYGLDWSFSQIRAETFMEAARSRNLSLRVLTHKPVSADHEDAELLEILPRFKLVLFLDAAYLHWTKYLESCGCRVLFMGAAAYPGVNRITGDLFGGVTELAEYLVALGHRRIMYLDILSSAFPSSPNLKFIAYCKTMERHGLEASFRSTSTPGKEIDAYRVIRECIGEWRGGKPRPTAIMAGTDIQARGVIEALQEAGLSVPQDISVTGIDDRPEAASANPALTTLSANHSQMVAAAMQWVDKVFSDQQEVPPLDVVIPNKLMIRQSTAAPCSAAP